METCKNCLHKGVCGEVLKAEVREKGECSMFADREMYVKIDYNDRSTPWREFCFNVAACIASRMAKYADVAYGMEKGDKKFSFLMVRLADLLKNAWVPGGKEK